MVYRSGASRFFNATKGGQKMACNHEQIKSVNCVLFCLKCGEKLPADFMMKKDTPAAPEAAEMPAEPQKAATRKRTTRKGGK